MTGDASASTPGLHRDRALGAGGTYWAIGDGRQGALGTFLAVLRYPSGTTQTHEIFPTQRHGDGWLCVELRVGRWTQDYHIRLIRPERC